MEIDILKRFGTHKNLTTFYGVFLAEPDPDSLERHPQDKLWLVMELCDAGSVMDLGDSIKPKSFPEAVRFGSLYPFLSCWWWWWWWWWWPCAHFSALPVVLSPFSIPPRFTCAWLQIIAYIVRETTEAIRFLHKNLIIHRDIKGQNVLMTSQGEVKLGACVSVCLAACVWLYLAACVWLDVLAASVCVFAWMCWLCAYLRLPRVSPPLTPCARPC